MLSPLRALTAHPIFVLSNGGKALTQALHEQDAAALLSAVVERDLAGVFNAAPNDYASWADIARLSHLPTVSLPRSLLSFATRFNTVWPALQGFTRDVVDLFSESLVVDNTLVRQVTGWMPRHTTRQAFAQLFGAEAHELSSVRGVTG
jgi:UDP-glucose 4-epimerase